MPPRSSRITRVTIDFDAAAGLERAAAAAGAVLRRHPFGDHPSDVAAAVLARTLLLTQKKRQGRKTPAVLRVLRAAAVAVALFHGAYILATSATLLIFKHVDPGATTLMVYRKYWNGWQVRQPRVLPLEKIPRSVRTMTIRVEDGSFYEHHGILLAAMKHAYKLNKAFGEPVYGGSTITMQTARTIFLVPEKSYVRKYLEVIVALEMEVILGKDRILELYFNYAEWGKGIFGIDAASRYHYKAGIASLSRDQSIRLVTLLSSPILHGPYTFNKNGILLARYAYLNARWGTAAQAVPAETLQASSDAVKLPSEAAPSGAAADSSESAPSSDASGTPSGPPSAGDSAVDAQNSDRDVRDSSEAPPVRTE